MSNCTAYGLTTGPTLSSSWLRRAEGQRVGVGGPGEGREAEDRVWGSALCLRLQLQPSYFDLLPTAFSFPQDLKLKEVSSNKEKGESLPGIII